MYSSRSAPTLKNLDSTVMSTFVAATVRFCCAVSKDVAAASSLGAAANLDGAAAVAAIWCRSYTASRNRSRRSLAIDACCARTESRHASRPNSHAQQCSVRQQRCPGICSEASTSPQCSASSSCCPTAARILVDVEAISTPSTDTTCCGCNLFGTSA